MGELEDVHQWLNAPVLAGALVNGLLGTAFALWAQNWAQERMSSAQTALVFTLEPVFAAAIGWIALGQAMSWFDWLGGLLIVASMAVVSA